MKIELNSLSRSYSSIEVLPFLKGRKIDRVVMGYLHALRPSSIRTHYGTVQCDASRWRVSIWLNKDETIREISQEVEVGLYDGVEHGEHLRQLLNDSYAFDTLPDDYEVN